MRFLGRRVYVAVVLMLSSPPRSLAARQLSDQRSIPSRTLRRWRRWWTHELLRTPFWQATRSRFMPPEDSFNWTSVAASALTAGILKGTPIGEIGTNVGSTAFTQGAIDGVVGSFVNQGVNIALGLQKSFSWKEVAISSLSAGAANAAGSYVGGKILGARGSEGWAKFGRNVTAGATSALVRRAAGGRMETDAVLADVFGTALGNSIVDRMSPQPVAGPQARGASADELQEVQITPKYMLDEVEVTARRLENNPRLIDPSRNLSPDQRVAQEASARQLAEAVQRIPDPPADLQTLEEVVVVGSRSGTGPSMRQIDQSFMGSAWDSWRHSWGSKLRDLKHAVNGPGPLIDPRSVIDAGKGALSYVADNLMMAVPGSSYFGFGQDAEQRLRARYSSLGDRVERAASESLDKINLFAETVREGDTASAGWMWGETVSDVQAWTAEEGAYLAAGGGLGKLGEMGRLAKVADDLGVPASRSTNPLSPVLEFDAYGNEIFYRTMSPGDFAKLQRTGKIPATGETFISPSEVYSRGYEGVLVRVTTKPGTTQQLMGMGVTANPGTANLFPALPSATKGWTASSAMFKLEGTVVNTGLGRGNALSTFNQNIVQFTPIR